MSKLILILFPVFGLLVISGCGGSNADIVNDTAAAGEPPAVISGNVPDETPTPREPLHEEPLSNEPEETPPEPATLRLDAEIVTKGVTPNDAIVLITDQPLDASTVVTSIELRAVDTTETRQANVVYDSYSKHVVITPDKPLEQGKRYAIRVDGAQDARGNPITVSGQTTFFAKPKLYSRKTIYNEDGSIRLVQHHERLVTDPFEARNIQYKAPGADMDWATEIDNVVSLYERIIALPHGGNVTTRCTSAGENDTWFDADDGCTSSTRIRRNRNGLIVEILGSNDPGGNGTFFDSDDNYFRAHFSRFDGEGRRLVQASFPQWGDQVNPGPDGLWMTGDDSFEVYERSTYNDLGQREYVFLYEGKGDDGEWFTVDDGPRSYDRFEYDSIGRRVKTLSFYNSGANSTWFDADDKGFLHLAYWTGDVRIREYYDPGMDELPETFDDTLKQYEYEKFDERGRILATGIFIARGEDWHWNTEDDVLKDSGSIHSYGQNDHGIIEQVSFLVDGNGEDGLRFSGDETKTMKTVRGYDDTSLLSYQRIFVPSDPGSEWNESGAYMLFDWEYITDH